jgi:hypothetical protein
MVWGCGRHRAAKTRLNALVAALAGTGWEKRRPGIATMGTLTMEH